LPRPDNRDWSIEMNRLALVFGSAAASALLSYWLDPDTGRRRRALAADRLTRTANDGRRLAGLVARDASHRGAGLAAQARSLLRNNGHADDATLVARVRSQLGRVVSHPHALDVTARDGHVTLSGPLLAREADGLLACAKRVHGVADVEDRLSRYDSAEHVSALQGGVERPGPSRWEFAQQTWAPAPRVLGGGVGLALLAAGLLRRGPLAALLGLAGACLFARSATNVDLAHLLRAGGPSVKVEKSIRIDAPVERVFAFWRDVQNFPRFMSHVHEVTGDVAGITHWSVDGFAGPAIEWTAECTGLVDNRLIAWSTLPGSAVRHAGVVTFDEGGDGSTRVTVRLDYQPPAGAIGDRLARLIGFDPKHQLDDDLMRAKSFLETGRPAHDAAVRTPRSAAFAYGPTIDSRKPYH
jgi:uncharacterized membrane protein